AATPPSRRTSLSWTCPTSRPAVTCVAPSSTTCASATVRPPRSRRSADRKAPGLTGTGLDPGPRHPPRWASGPFPCAVKTSSGDRGSFGATRLRHVGGSDSPAPAIGSPTTESLGVQTATLVGVLAWCSFIHLPPNRILVALAECARAVWTGGGLAVGFFTGRRTEPFDHAVTTAYR